MDLTFSLLRPDDLLALTVEATNLRLDTSDPASPRLVSDTAGQPATLTFHVPAAGDRGMRLLPGPRRASPRRRSTRRRATRRCRRSPCRPATEQPALPGAVDVRMSGESRLVFEYPTAWTAIPYTVEGLLDWSKLTLVLPPAAQVPPGASQATGHGPPAIAEPAPGQTAIELPYRLLLAPNVASQVTPAWLHAVDAGHPRRPHRALAHPARLAGRRARRRARRGVGGQPAAAAAGLVAGLRRRRPAAASLDRRRPVPLRHLGARPRPDRHPQRGLLRLHAHHAGPGPSTPYVPSR